MIKGIDVSKHNGEIDWSKVKSDGIDFAILRAGFGKYDNQKDEFFEENYKSAVKNNISLGAYLYSYAKSVEDAKREAKTFIKWLEGKKFDMPVIYDVEEKAQAQYGKEFVSSIIKAFCEEMEKAGYYVGVYSSKSWFDNYIDDECKKRYDCWVAQWAKENTYKGNYGMWQFSATGKVKGINGSVDLNYAYKDYKSIIKSGGFNGYEKSENSTAKVEKKPEKPTVVKPTPVVNTFTKGKKITLKNTPVYISSTAKKLSVRKSGIFYLYDGKEIKSRFRITTKISNCGKTPLVKYVTGYVNKSDIK